MDIGKGWVSAPSRVELRTDSLPGHSDRGGGASDRCIPVEKPFFIFPNNLRVLAITHRPCIYPPHPPWDSWGQVAAFNPLKRLFPSEKPRTLTLYLTLRLINFVKKWLVSPGRFGTEWLLAI
jgi:hypothetical protein